MTDEPSPRRRSGVADANGQPIRVVGLGGSLRAQSTSRTSLDVTSGHLRGRRHPCAASGPEPSGPRTAAFVRRRDRLPSRCDGPRLQRRTRRRRPAVPGGQGFAPPQVFGAPPRDVRVVALAGAATTVAGAGAAAWLSRRRAAS
jgi:hypothetical protein